MGSVIDRSYFQELAGADSRDVCRRAPCRYDDATKSYTLSVWGDEFTVCPFDNKIMQCGDKPAEIDNLLGLFIVYCLLKCKDLKVSNEWISEKDLPGGVTFFRGPHAIPTGLISSKYNRDLGGFGERCRQLHGIPLEMADGAYFFSITPRIPVAVLLWDGDEDFSAESKVLFDRSITEHLTLDIVFSLADIVCRRVAGIPNASF